MRSIVYLPHPLSAEDKEKYVRMGYVIRDARFAPEGYEAPKPKGRPKKDDEE